MNKFTKPYEVRKSIKFKLIPEIQSKPYFIPDYELELPELLGSYKELIENLINFFYSEKEIVDKEDKTSKFSNLKWFKEAFANFDFDEAEEKVFDLKNKEFSKMPRLKHKFFKENFKEDWYAIKDRLIKKNKTKNYEILDSLPFFQKVLKDFFEKSEQLYKELDEIISSPDNASKRKSDLRFVLQKISWNEVFKKIIKLFSLWFVDHKNDVEIVWKISEELWEFSEKIQNAIELLKVNDSFWFPVEYLSLNYYTINKTPKEYDDEIKDKQDNLEKSYDWDLWALYGIDKNQTIEQLRNDMKMFKARQKSAFLEFLQMKNEFSELKELKTYLNDIEKKYKQKKWSKYNFYEELQNNTFKLDPSDVDTDIDKVFKAFSVILFLETKEDDYNKALELTKKIEKSHTSSERASYKLKRWEFFKFKNEDWIFSKDGGKNYVWFCSEFKKVAMLYWRFKAEKLSLEREKEQARFERWLAILSKDLDWNYYINSFSNNDSKKAFEKLKNINSISGDYSYFIMKSITLRALQKLCWKENFKKTVVNKISEKFTKVNENDTKGQVRKFKSFEEIGNNIVEFYVDILDKQRTLDVSYRSWYEEWLKILKWAKDLDELEILLKQETYTLEEHKISKNDFEKILEDYNWNSYKITSEDLEKNIETNNFTKWWNIFWTTENKEHKYISRLNPELVISLRAWEKAFKDRKKHRKSDKSFLLTMSYSHYTDKSYIDDAFIKDEERKSSLEQFNKHYNENHKFDYIYWLDKWTNELVTLWVFKKVWDKLEKVNISEEIPVYRITEKWLKYSKKYSTRVEWLNWEREIFLYKNPSLFIDEIDNEELFEKVSIDSCIWNLNCAKLIKWNIILNWDINWFLSLNKIAAKRHLYDAITKWFMLKDTITFDEVKNNFYYEHTLAWKKFNKVVFYLDSFESITTKDEIEKELNNYIKLVKEHKSEENVSIDWINKKRVAISWNIVWIILKLQEKFPWYIVWEALNLDQNNKNISSNHAFLWNLINDKIYQKLMISLDVPPILKKYRSELIKDTLTQHGKVFYINENLTSKACPSCNDTLTIEVNWILKEKDPNKDKVKVYQLFWHISQYENEMHHLTDEEYDNLYDNDKNFKKFHSNNNWNKKQNSYLAWENCDYNMKHNPKWFDFIQSWDDLATYNIAKKAKEYLEFLEKQKNNNS